MKKSDASTIIFVPWWRTLQLLYQRLAINSRQTGCSMLCTFRLCHQPRMRVRCLFVVGHLRRSNTKTAGAEGARTTATPCVDSVLPGISRGASSVSALSICQSPSRPGFPHRPRSGYEIDVIGQRYSLDEGRGEETILPCSVTLLVSHRPPPSHRDGC